ncbi:unnamed protein product [Calicophoron daubneyi]|uniref:BTB domain-containing protein n=1 Tax=Calicophoron daubneyi TaxID=300641 RepID=A0AAV2T090_CALDB
MAVFDMACISGSLVNPERASSEECKPGLFEFNANLLKGEQRNDIPSKPSTKESEGDYDIMFLVGRDVFRGHQSVFSAMSAELQKCFHLMESGLTDYSSLRLGGIIRISRGSSSSPIPKITIDAPTEAFRAVFDYCYSHKLSVSVDFVPYVYLLSKRLKVKHLQVPCADYLAQHVHVNNIGELCRLAHFGHLTDGTCDDKNAMDERLLADMHLTRAVYNYLSKKADAVACSLTGQLSARLIVNLTGDTNSDRLSSLSEDNSGAAANYCGPDEQQVAFAVLLWAHERIMSGERLARGGSEENVQSDDEESDAASVGSSSACCSKNIRPNQPFGNFDLENFYAARHPGQPKAESELLVSTNDEDEAQVEAESRVPDSQFSTQEIRIALDTSELPGIPLKNDMFECRARPNCETHSAGRSRHLLTFVPPGESLECETCLLVPTSLGVGTTSIWLGKLVGYLVTLSIKRCQSGSQFNSPQGSVFHQPSSGRNGSLVSVSTSNLVCEATNEDDGDSARQQRKNGGTGNVTDESKENDEAALTITPTSGSHLARIVANHATDECDSVISTVERKRTVPCMLEARSGAGAGLISVEGRNYLVLLGGYTRKGCLNSVELFSENKENITGDSGNTDNPGLLTNLSLPYTGPKLNKLRGRLGVASVSRHLANPEADVIYACGGSTGSVDLTSVERLTSTSLEKWLSEQQGTSDSTDESDGHSSNRSNSSSPFWQYVAPMHQARSSPTAVGLTGLRTSALVSNSTGSIAVAGGFADAVSLSTVEAYIPERNQWIMLPNMSEGRCEAAAGILADKNLIVVAGGNWSNSAGSSLGPAVEALDLRCSEWISLPVPNLGGNGVLRGAAMAPSPNSMGGLLLIGGFNGRDTLNTVWIFDPVAWRWIPGPPLKTARTNACAVTSTHCCSTFVLGGYNVQASKSGFLDSVELISLV